MARHLRLIAALIDVAKQKGCYKVILDCAEKNAAFYEKCGLTRKEIQMVGAGTLGERGGGGEASCFPCWLCIIVLYCF